MNLELREKISKIWRGCNEKEAINQILALIGKCGGKEVNYFRILEICKGAIRWTDSPASNITAYAGVYESCR